jgi:filamentous hemagglutinin
MIRPVVAIVCLLSLLHLAPLPLLEAADYTWGGQAGTSGWYDTAVSSPGPPPQYVNNFGMVGAGPAFPGPADGAVLGAYTVDTNGSPNVNTLSLGGTLTIHSPNSVTVHSAITNNGVIRLHDTTDGAAATLAIDGQVLLGGTGQILFCAGPEDDNLIDYPTSPASRLTIGAGQTVTTEPTGSGRIIVQAVNQGLIDADAGTIYLEATAKTNQNLIRARNGGTLKFQANCTIDNSAGTIATLAGSFVDLGGGLGGGAAITGGTLEGAGTFRSAGAATLENLTLAADATFEVRTNHTIKLKGTITNRGVIRIHDNAVNYAYLNATGAVLLDGPGKVLFTSTTDDDQVLGYTATTDMLTIGAEQMVATAGAGVVGFVTAPLTNTGLVEADGGTLRLEDRPKINRGRFSARNGGVLLIYGCTVNNASGLIASEPGANVDFGGSATVTGGTLSGAGLRGAGVATLADLTLAAAAVLEAGNGDIVKLSGAIVNDGTIRINDAGTGYAYLNTAGNVQLNGAGKVLFTSTTDSGQYLEYSAAGDMLTVGPQQTIATAGPGVIGHLTAPLTNTGLVEADGGTLRLEDRPKANQGRFSARNGGVLLITGCTVNNAGGSIAPEAGGYADFGGSAVVTGGTLSGAGLRIAGTATLDGATIDAAGALEVGPSDTLVLRGTVGNLGLIRLNDNGNGYAIVKPGSGGATLSGNGRVQFAANGSGAWEYFDYSAPADLLTLDAGQIVETTGATSYGWIYTKLLNRGSIEANGGFLDLLDQSKTNEGRFLSRSGGRFRLQTTLTNYDPATDTLTGGAYEVQAGSTLDLGTNGPIVVNAANITLKGAGSALTAVNPLAEKLAENRGSLTITNGRTFTTAGGLLNSGALVVGAGSTFTVTDNLTDGPGGTGITTVEGSLVADAIVQQTLAIGAGGSVTIRETTAAASAVPEPGAWALLSTAGLGGLAALCRRKRRLTAAGRTS